MARTLSIMHYSENGIRIGFERYANDNTWYATMTQLYENGKELQIAERACRSIVGVVDTLKELKKEGYNFKYEMR